MTLLLIFILGLGLRFYRLPQQVWEQDGYDESRDMLVARHIVQHQARPQRGPLAAGGLNWLKNSPVYFYFVASIWKITQNPTLFMYAWASLMSLQIGLAFLVGRELQDDLTGLLTAILVALQRQQIYQSRQLLQPFLLPIFSLLFVWLLLKNCKKRKLWRLLMAIITLLLPLHFHYSIFLLLPLGLIWISYEWGQLIEQENNLANIFLPWLTFLGMLTSWLLLTYVDQPLDQLYFFIFNFRQQTESWLGSWQQTTDILINQLWPQLNYKNACGLTLFLVTIGGLKLKDKTRRHKYTLILSLTLSFAWASLFTKTTAETYLLSTQILFLPLFALGLRRLIKIQPIAGWITTILVLILTIVPTSKLLTEEVPAVSFYHQQQKIAEIIQKEQGEKTDFALTGLNTHNSLPFDGWAMSGIWFQLENLYQQKLVKVTNYGVNFSPLVTQAKNLYFICDHRIKPEKVETECFKRFKQARDYLLPNEKIIFENKNYTVWQFEIKPNSKVGRYTQVYSELLKVYKNVSRTKTKSSNYRR
ncbi:MAG: hypothetical protein U9O78_01565 [Patescibacteria group bacterium]|nr:hypothetical protein [Patescibacteria group bacterium]